MLIGATLGRYLSLRFAKTILMVFGTVFALVYTLDFVELMRRAGDAEGATPALMAQLAAVPHAGGRRAGPALRDPVRQHGGAAPAQPQARTGRRARGRASRPGSSFSPASLSPPSIGIVSVDALQPPLGPAEAEGVGARGAHLLAQDQAASGKDLWIRQKSLDGQAIIRAEAAIENTTTIAARDRLHVRRRRRLRRADRSRARRALRDGYWELSDARVLGPSEQPQSYGTYILASNLEPSQVRQSFTPPDSVPFWNLDETIAQTERAGLDATRYRLQYDVLLARPLLFVAMVFVAASVSLRFFRFGGVARMVLGGVAAGFVLYVATELMEDLGASGLVGPTVAAWFPAVVGSLLGTLALLYQEDG